MKTVILSLRFIGETMNELLDPTRRIEVKDWAIIIHKCSICLWKSMRTINKGKKIYKQFIIYLLRIGFLYITEKINESN